MEPGAIDSATTLELVTRANAGDAEAQAALLRRHLPRLRRWARGRLPMWARDLADTDDIVQETLLQTLRNLPTFEARGEGAFQAYLRQAVMNRVRDEIRRVMHRPARTELDNAIADSGLSPVELAVGREFVEKYEEALRQLRPIERELIIARVELGCSYREVAELTGKPTDEAARIAVGRALVRLVQLIPR